MTRTCERCDREFTPRREDHRVCPACVARYAKEFSAAIQAYAPMVARLFEQVADHELKDR